MTDKMAGYKSLTVSNLESDATYARAYSHQRNLVSMNSSALEVMTDLHFVPASTIGAQDTLGKATQQMISQGVRLLLVADNEARVTGLITTRDFDSDARDDDHLVESVMTPVNEIEVIAMGDLLYAVVGDLVETLKQSKRQHALAAEMDHISGLIVIRGVFSATQIARQLGVAVKSTEILQTFEQIDRVVNGSSI